MQRTPRHSLRGMVKDKVRKAPRRNMAITFDMDARKEYLTGFHKRKLERQKLGRAEMEMRARREKLAERKEVRLPPPQSSSGAPLLLPIAALLTLPCASASVATRSRLP